MKTPLKSVLAAGTMLMGVGSTQVQAQNFGSAYFFGDSLTDCCVTGRYTNSRAPNWADQFAQAIGAGYTAALRNNQAVGGAQSGQNNAVSFLELPGGSGFLPQVQKFVAQGITISSRDIAGIWIGTNDIWPSALPPVPSANQPIGSRPSVPTLTNYVTGNVRAGINNLVAQGFRSIALISPFDLGASEVFANFGGADATTRVLATQYSEAFRNSLASLYTPGVNTYFLDTLTLLRRVQANPSLYGFDRVTAAENCSALGCTTLPLEQQNRFVFVDGIHTTSGFDLLMARYLANSINARTSLSAQGDLGQAVGQTFSNTLLNRLDAYRNLSAPMTVPGTYTADLPSRSVVPSEIPVMLGSPLSIFAEGTYAGIDRNAVVNPVGPNSSRLGADFAGVTAGIAYRVTPNFLVGAAFNYLNTTVDLRGSSNARIDLDSYQGGVFGSYNTANFFVDGAVTYGVNNYGLSRPGVLNDRLTASPDGNTLTVAGKIGYLFNFATFRVGPIAELTYANVHLGSYSERGDSLLTLGVRQQDFDGLTGGAGIQIRTALPILGGVVSPFVNLTAQHDFLDGVRTIASFSTNAPALLINTGAGRRAEDVYGKVAGGLSIDLGNGLSGVVTGSATFGRSYGDDCLVSGSLRYRF